MWGVILLLCCLVAGVFGQVNYNPYTPQHSYNPYNPYYNRYNPYNPYVNPYTPYNVSALSAEPQPLQSATLDVDINPSSEPETTTKQINQFQIAIILPPGYKPDPDTQNGLWLQIPGYTDLTTPTPPTNEQQPPVQYDPISHIPAIVQGPTAPVKPPVGPPGGPQVLPIFVGPGYPHIPGAPAIPPYPHIPGVPAIPPVPGVPGGVQEVTNPLLLRCARPRGQFPSDFCNTFINCWDGTAVEQFCPSTLVFNPAGFCDYGYNYICNKPYKAQPAPSLPPPGSTGSGAWVPPSTVTSPPHVTVSHPPPVSITPPSVSSPRPPTFVSTVRPAIISSTVAPPPQLTPAQYAALKKKCLKPRGQFPTGTCYKYVNCWDAWVSEQECPKGLLFNLAGFCDYPENVNCYNRTILPAPFSECPQPFGTFRNASHCNAAFTCSANLVISRFECPVGYNYNDNIGVCDFAYRVNCGPKTYGGNTIIPSVIHQVPGSSSNYQPQLDQAWVRSLCQTGNLVRLAHDCSKVAFCRNGLPEVVSCNSGLGYDTQTDRCTLLHYARC